MLPPDTHSLLGDSERAFSQGIESDSNRRPSAWEAYSLTTMRPQFIMLVGLNLLYIAIFTIIASQLKITN